MIFEKSLEQKVKLKKVKKSEKREDVYSCTKCEYEAKKKQFYKSTL